MRLLSTLLLAATLAACSAETGSYDHAHSDMAKSDGTIMVSSAFVREPVSAQSVSGGYFKLTNHTGQDDKLLSVTSPISDNVELHTHKKEDGVMKMRRIMHVDLPAGETVTFKPGGLHLMMFQTDMPDGTEDVSLTLNFENAEPVTVIAEVGSPPIDDTQSGH